MEELILTRDSPNDPWGFRLTGGKNFGTPLTVVKVRFITLNEIQFLITTQELMRDCIHIIGTREDSRNVGQKSKNTFLNNKEVNNISNFCRRSFSKKIKTFLKYVLSIHLLKTASNLVEFLNYNHQKLRVFI